MAATKWLTDEEAAPLIEKAVRRGYQPAFKNWKRMTREQQEGFWQALDLYDAKYRPEDLATRERLNALYSQRSLYTPFTPLQLKQWEAALAGQPCPREVEPSRGLAASAATVAFAAAGQAAGLCLFLINPVGALLLIGLLAEGSGRR